MFLGVSTTHALRAVAHLAGEDGGVVLGRDLARTVGVPAPYLAKVLATLARVGVLSATRGARGGYRLARPAEQIRLAEVVGPFEGKRAAPTCLLRPGHACREESACAAHAAWNAVNEAYQRFLDTTTVADVQGRVDAPARAEPRARRRGAASRPRRRARPRARPS